MGSHGFPPTSSNPVADKAVLWVIGVVVMKAEAVAAKAAARSRRAMLISLNYGFEECKQQLGTMLDVLGILG